MVTAFEVGVLLGVAAACLEGSTCEVGLGLVLFLRYLCFFCFFAVCCCVCSCSCVTERISAV